MVIESKFSTIFINVTNQGLVVYYAMYIVCGCHGSKCPPSLRWLLVFTQIAYTTRMPCCRRQGILSSNIRISPSAIGTFNHIWTRYAADHWWEIHPCRAHDNNWRQGYWTKCELLHGTYSCTRGTMDGHDKTTSYLSTRNGTMIQTTCVCDICSSIGVSLSCEYNA